MKQTAALILTLLALTLTASACASAPPRAAIPAAQHTPAPQTAAQHTSASGTAHAPVAAAASAAAASATPVMINCSLQPQTGPSWFILTCADAGDDLTSLHWVSWGSSAAFATAVEQVNDCTPDCADGKFIDYPALVALWRPEPLPGHPGQYYFTRVTRIYTANRPPLYYCTGTRTCYPQTATTPLWP